MKEKYIDLAYKEACKAYKNDDVPVGAIIIKDNQIVAKAHNCKNNSNLIMNHAEMIAIKKASKKLQDWRLNDCEMYITLEPCPMCASAIQQSRIKKIYIGTKSNISINSEVIEKILNSDEYNYKVKIEYLNDSKCSAILSDFFDKKRKKINNHNIIC